MSEASMECSRLGMLQLTCANFEAAECHVAHLEQSMACPAQVSAKACHARIPCGHTCLCTHDAYAHSLWNQHFSSISAVDLCAVIVVLVRLPVLVVQVKRHMDLGTLLHHVDHHMYPTTAPFLADVAIIPEAWALYYEVSV